MSDNFTGLKITAVSDTQNADGSTPITLEDGTVHNLKAGLTAAVDQYLVIDTTTNTENVVSMLPTADVEVVEPVTFPTFADAVAAASAGVVAVVSTSGVAITVPVDPQASVTLLVGDLTAPWTVQAASVTV